MTTASNGASLPPPKKRKPKAKSPIKRPTTFRKMAHAQLKNSVSMLSVAHFMKPVRLA